MTTTNVQEIRPGDPGGEPPADDAAATPAGDSAARIPVVRVQARPGWIGVNLRELWQYRDLLGFLASRDIKVRYKQTALGIAWAVVQPIVETLVFFVFFHNLGGVQSDGPNYLVFAFAAMLVWKLFENALTQSSNSLVANQQLLTKVYFPRLIIPIAAVLSGLMDFAIAAVLLIPLMVYFKLGVGLPVLLLPVFVIFTLAAALSVGLWLSALNVQYRDIRYLVPFMIRVWFFLTPVIYPASKIPAKWQWVYGLNPMAGAVTGFRWALLGHSGSDPSDKPGILVAISAASTVVLLVGGLFYFRRMEKTFADVV